MQTLRRLRDGRWAVARRPLHRRVGRVLLGSAIVLAILPLVLEAGPGDLTYLWIVAGVFSVIGLLYARASPWTTLDAEAGIVDVGRGPQRGGDFVVVRLGSKVRKFRDDAVRLYTVGLTVPEVDPAAAEHVAALRRLLGPLDAEREQLRADLERWGPQLSQVQRLVTQTPNEAEAWVVGELLARALDLPMLDFSGGRPMQRVPAQLDEPLVQRLAAERPPPAQPGPPPPDLQVESSPRRLRLSWRAPRAELITGLLTLAAMLALCLWLAWSVDVPEVGLPVGALLVWLAIAVVTRGRGSGRNVLEVAEGELRHTTRFPTTRTDVLSLGALEHVRDQATPSPTVSLVADGTILVLTGSAAQTRFIRRQLEHWLATSTQAPPRH